MEIAKPSSTLACLPACSITTSPLVPAPAVIPICTNSSRTSTALSLSIPDSRSQYHSRSTTPTLCAMHVSGTTIACPTCICCRTVSANNSLRRSFSSYMALRIGTEVHMNLSTNMLSNGAAFLPLMARPALGTPSVLVSTLKVANTLLTPATSY